MTPGTRNLLRSLERFGEKPGLARIEFLLNKLGRPQERFPAVHIAGTNGKGSTGAMIAAVLKAGGRRVGLFTSPHLLRYNERIVVDGEPIGDEELAKLLDTLAPYVAEAAATPGVGQPTEFEVATAAALAHFAEQGADVAVVEVGLGGRLDSTNVVHPCVSVITSIDVDHTAVLGTDLVTIAGEKAGIIRSGVPVVMAKQLPEAAAVVRQRARRTGAPLVEQGVDFNGTPVGVDMHGTRFDLQLSGPDLRLENVGIPLVGVHQVDNAAVAAAAALVAEGALGRELSGDAAETILRTGFGTARWPGRFEIVDEEPLTIVDGAHNAASARALAHTVEAVFTDEPIVFVIGMLAEKSPDAILEPLLPLAEAIVFTKPSQGRTAPAEPKELERVARAFIEDSPGAPGVEIVADPSMAVRRARELAGADGVVIVAGSLYLVGEVKGFFAGNCRNVGE